MLVLLDRGYSGLSTVEVAARAGVSRGALAHYYRTREDLILAATRHLMERGTEETMAAAERARGAADPVEHFVADTERFFLDPSYVAMIELLVAARTNPSFRSDYVPIVEKWRARINDIWLGLFHDAGIARDRAELILLLTNNLMRGMALTSLWEGGTATRDALLDRWRGMVKELAEHGALRPGAAA